ncbi:MAG TPA: phosphoglycerate dehydrogenase [Candidatus Hypogeohydataceae bacterium YC41]
MKVLIADSLAKECEDILLKAGLEVAKRPGISQEELAKEIKDYAGIILRSGVKITEQVLAGADRLKVICRAGIGVDNVDVEEATKRGIIVMNTPEANAISAAEHTIGLLFAAARKISQAHKSLQRGEWKRDKFMGLQVMGKTLGIIGLGRVGRLVAKRAVALEMKVMAFDPFVSPEIAAKYNIKCTNTLEELLRQSDFITIHVPLNASTRNLITKREFALMKPGVILVNDARGGIVNEKDLYDAIVSGKVAGAAMDVFEVEPPKDNKLLELEQVVATPHLGAQTVEAQKAVALEAAEQIADSLLGRGIRNALNLPVVNPEEFAQLRPFINFAERMGTFLMQIIGCGVRTVTLIYAGEIAKKNTKLVTDSFLVGILKPCIEEGANLVSASALTMEKGIEVSVTTSAQCGDFTNLITAKVKTDTTESTVTGTIFNKGDARLVFIDGYTIEAVLEGVMLAIYAKDRPGLIGNVGTIMGNEDINIARMAFGRKRAGGTALLIVNLDCPISLNALEAIEKLEGVEAVRLIQLPLYCPLA